MPDQRHELDLGRVEGVSVGDHDLQLVGPALVGRVRGALDRALERFKKKWGNKLFQLSFLLSLNALGSLNITTPL